jgi:hypothetical protein
MYKGQRFETVINNYLTDIVNYVLGKEFGDIGIEPENYIVYVKLYNSQGEIDPDAKIMGGEPLRLGFAFVKESNGPCKRTV